MILRTTFKAVAILLGGIGPIAAESAASGKPLSLMMPGPTLNAAPMQPQKTPPQTAVPPLTPKAAPQVTTERSRAGSERGQSRPPAKAASFNSPLDEQASQDLASERDEVAARWPDSSELRLPGQSLRDASGKSSTDAALEKADDAGVAAARPENGPVEIEPTCATRSLASGQLLDLINTIQGRVTVGEVMPWIASEAWNDLSSASKALRTSNLESACATISQVRKRMKL